MRTARLVERRDLEELLRRITAAVWHVETERLVLRRPTKTDLPAWAANIDDVVVATNGWTPKQAKRARKYLVPLRRWPRSVVEVLVTGRDSGEVVGSVSVHSIDLRDCSCHLGWSIGPQARGRGYAPEAAAAVVGALHAAGVARVWMGTGADNRPARRVLAKIGGTEVGRGPHRLPDGSVVTSLWYRFDAVPADATGTAAS